MVTGPNGSWRDYPQDCKEKYAAYLCSREWGLLKRQVHERSGGKCERCFRNPLQAVHHKNYLRKYAEELEDLQAICNACHDFEHGRSDFDPAAVVDEAETTEGPLPLIQTDENSQLLCPICGSDNVHIQAVEVYQGNLIMWITRETAVSRTRPNSEITARGSLVSVRMFCEGGHTWQMDLQFHKGSTIGVITEGRDIGNESPSELWRD